MRVVVLVTSLGLVFGCTKRHTDPAPPAASAELPAAPPKALGARAASLEPPPTPTPFSEEPEQEESEGTEPDDKTGPLGPDAGAIPL